MSVTQNCPECRMPFGEHAADCQRPALLADLEQAKLAERAANDCNRTWQDVSDDFVFAESNGEPSRIPPEALRDYLQRFPQYHDRLIQLYEDWNKEPLITDEMLAAVEHSDADAGEESRHWMRAKRILTFYDKLRRIEAERDELIAFVKHVAEHFENTRLPLGIQARDLLAKYSVPA